MKVVGEVSDSRGNERVEGATIFLSPRLLLLVIILVVDHSIAAVEMLWGCVVSFFIMKFILSLFKSFLLSTFLFMLKIYAFVASLVVGLAL